MRIVRPAEDAEHLAFAAKAHASFKANQTFHTFAHGEPKPGDLFAVRWNDFTVLVLKIEDCSEVLLYDTASLPEVKCEKDVF